MGDRAPVGLKNINHTWPSSGTRACIDVCLDVYPGTVHALVGENGAGKTTLGHILAGVRRPDTGRLVRGSQEMDLSSRRIGPVPGIGLVRQRSNWPKGLELWEAAILGREGAPLRRSRWLKRFSDVTEDWGLAGLDPKISVGRMDAAALQLGQLAASLMFDPDIVVLDEPVAGWEEGRAGEFFRLLEQLKSRGITVLMITHRLNDVFRTADRVTVMRQGRIVLSRSAGELEGDELTARMFGSDHPNDPDEPLVDSGGQAVNRQSGSPRLSCRGVGLRSAGREELTDVTFDIRPGEIVAVTGLKEEGLGGLESIISGNTEPTTGAVFLEGRPIDGGNVGMRPAGLGYVPSDAVMRGASLGSTVAENMLVLESRRLAKRGWLTPQTVRRWAERRRNAGEIRGEPDQRLEELSGGNIQKLILQRELETGRRVLLAADLALGLDEKSRRRVYRRVNELADQGTAVLLLASDLDEAMELSHRMGIISRGRLSPIRPTQEWSRREATALIAGASFVEAGVPS